MICRPDRKQLEVRPVSEDLYYVWDNVAVALDVGKTKVLKFDADRLRNNLKYCLQDDDNYIPKDHIRVDFDEAKAVVKNLWPGWRGPLEMESPLLQRLMVTNVQLVLVGWPGVGKSSSGNTILGKDVFGTNVAAARSPTGRTCSRLQRGNLFNSEVTVIDTPAFPESSNNESKEDIFRLITLSTPDPHAVLLVIRLGFPTSHSEETVELMEDMFGKNVWSRTMIVLTHLERTEPDLQEQLQKNGEQLKLLFWKVGNRCQLLNNNPDVKNVQQVWDLLSAVKEMLVNNNLV